APVLAATSLSCPPTFAPISSAATNFPSPNVLRLLEARKSRLEASGPRSALTGAEVRDTTKFLTVENQENLP
ncbi:MAG: hypothetical protein WCA58_04355, partial [Terriglobales bacterium]